VKTKGGNKTLTIDKGLCVAGAGLAEPLKELSIKQGKQRLNKRKVKLIRLGQGCENGNGFA